MPEEAIGNSLREVEGPDQDQLRCCRGRHSGAPVSLTSPAIRKSGVALASSPFEKTSISKNKVNGSVNRYGESCPVVGVDRGMHSSRRAIAENANHSARREADPYLLPSYQFEEMSDLGINSVRILPRAVFGSMPVGFNAPLWIRGSRPRLTGKPAALSGSR